MRSSCAVVIVPVAVAEEAIARVAHARCAAKSDAAELAHSGWALADYSAGLGAGDWARTVVLAAPWAAGPVLAYLVAAGLVVLTANGSSPAGWM